MSRGIRLIGLTIEAKVFLVGFFEVVLIILFATLMAPGLGESGGQTTSLLVKAALWILIVMVALQRENRYTILDWLGLLPKHLHQEEFLSEQKPRMLMITRLFCYMLIALSLATFSWWPGFMNLATNASAGVDWLMHFSLAVFAVTATAEHFWFLKKTRVPLVLAVILLYQLIKLLVGFYTADKTIMVEW